MATLKISSYINHGLVSHAPITNNFICIVYTQIRITDSQYSINFNAF